MVKVLVTLLDRVVTLGAVVARSLGGLGWRGSAPGALMGRRRVVTQSLDPWVGWVGGALPQEL